MILIYHANSTQFQQRYSREKLLTQLPTDMWAKALRYKFMVDSYNYILGRLMLKKGLQDSGFPSDKLSTLYFNKYEKPLIKGVYFNISHSKDRVLCAISKNIAIGIDIEVEGRVKISDLRSFFTEGEWTDIMSADDKKKRLYQYWTRKESILKAIGTGLAKLEDIHLLDEKTGFHKSEKNRWHFHELDLGQNCITTLCTKQETTDIKIIPFSV
jgi:4'-phosphopantetheinyl transferase